MVRVSRLVFDRWRDSGEFFDELRRGNFKIKLESKIPVFNGWWLRGGWSDSSGEGLAEAAVGGGELTRWWSVGGDATGELRSGGVVVERKRQRGRGRK